LVGRKIEYIIGFAIALWMYRAIQQVMDDLPGPLALLLGLFTAVPLPPRCPVRNHDIELNLLPTSTSSSIDWDLLIKEVDPVSAERMRAWVLATGGEIDTKILTLHLH
jgi:hypothetical protein